MVEVEHIEPPPRWPERPGQILEATCRAILDRGFPATRISDIAREAGMSTGAVHYYFQGKDDVLVAALRYSGRQLFDQLDPVVEGDASELAKLAILLELATPFPGARRDSWQLWIELWTHLLHEPHLIPACEPISARWRSYFFTIVRRGTENGEFDPVTDPDEVAERLTGLLDGMGFETVVGYSWTSPKHTRDRVLDFAAEQLRVSRSALNRHSCAVPRTERGRALR
jgi:AcrR family transcriptional regulator